MSKLGGTAANITRADKITAKERDAIIEMIKLHPTPSGDKIVAEKFGRSVKTIEALRQGLQREKLPSGGTQGINGQYFSEPFRQIAVLDFAKKYGKPFTIKTLTEYLGPYTSYAGLLRRLTSKGYFTSRIVKMHRRRKDGALQRVKTLVVIPTALVFEDE